ncbi:uncharacterized protein LOC144140068 [Haemaphysalis longicornis]
MNSSAYILMLVLYSASFISALGAVNNSSAGAGTTSTEASVIAGGAEKTNNASTNAQKTSTGGTKAGGDEQNTDGTSAPETTSTGVSEREENGENTSGSSNGSETTSEEGSESAEDGDNADASSTPQDNMQKASETTGSTDKASPENGSCIQVTLPDVLGIGKCLQANLDLCQNENTLIPGVMTLVNCTVTSLFNNLTPKTFFVTVKDILVALIGKLVPGVVHVAEKYLEETKSGENTTIANGTCEGEIKIGIPNSLGKCLDKTLKLCEKGKPIDVSVVTPSKVDVPEYRRFNEPTRTGAYQSLMFRLCERVCLLIVINVTSYMS